MVRKEIKYIGYWKIIGSKSNVEYYGILTYHYSKGIHLEITTKKNIKINEKKIKYITGVTQNNLQITLIDSEIFSRPSFEFDGLQKTYKFFSTIILEGIPIFKKSTKIKFDYIAIFYNSINKWVNYCPFKTSINRAKDKNVIIKKMRSICLKIDSIKSEIKIINSINNQSYEHKKIEYNSEIGFEIHPKNNKDFDWYQRICYDLQNFILLLSGFYFPVLKMEGYIKRQDGSFDLINIIYRPIDYKFKNNIHKKDINFPFDLIKKDLKKILNKWFLIAEKIRATIDLLYSSIVNSSGYLNFTFLSLTQALENIHRILFSLNTYYKIGDFEKIKLNILNKLPANLNSDYKSSLRNRIKFSNEFSLRKKMKDLLNELSYDLKLFFMSKTSNDCIDKIVKIIVDTRNYYTHYCMEEDSQIIDYFSLYFGNKSLIILIKILLLRQIGLKDEDIFNNFKDNQYYKPYFKILETINLMR